MKHACRDCGVEFETTRRVYCETCIVNHPEAMRNRRNYANSKKPKDSSPDKPKLACGHLRTLLIDEGCAACIVLAADNKRSKRSEPMRLVGKHPSKRSNS